MRPAIQLICLASIALIAFAEPSPQDEKAPGSFVLNTRVYGLINRQGNYLDVGQYIPDLSKYGFDDDIESVYQTGMWMYYEYINYNNGNNGRIYFVHGVDLGTNFPVDYRNMASSIRAAGKKTVPNEDTLTLYSGTYFTGDEYYTETDAGHLNTLDQSASSLILTGTSSWTLYSGQLYTGDSICVKSGTDHDVGPNGGSLDFGIYASVANIGIRDNSIRSVRKGCTSENIASPSTIEYQYKAKNGAWGYVDL